VAMKGPPVKNNGVTLLILFAERSYRLSKSPPSECNELLLIVSLTYRHIFCCGLPL